MHTSHRPPRSEPNLRVSLKTPRVRVALMRTVSLRQIVNWLAPRPSLLTSPIDLRKRAAFQKENDLAAR